MDMRRGVGSAVLVALMVAAMSAGAPLAAFFSPVTLGCIILGTMAAWMLSSGREQAVLWRVLRHPQPSVDALSRALVVARAGRAALWGVTTLAIVGHVVQLLNLLDDPTAYGPLLSTLFLAPLHALFLDLLVVGAIEQKVWAKAGQLGTADQLHERVELADVHSVGEREGARSPRSARTRF